MDKIKIFFVYFLTALIPFQVYFPVYDHKHLTMALVMGLMFFCFTFRKLKMPSSPVILVYGMFLLTITIRGIFAADKPETVKYILFLGMGLIYYQIYHYAEIKKENIVRVLVLSTLPMVLLMIYIYHHEQLELVILKQPLMKLFIEPDTLKEIFTVSYPNIQEPHRVGGFFVNSNIAALNLGLLLPIIIWLLKVARNRWKIIYGLIGSMFILAIIYTGSLGAIVALGFSGGAVGLILLFKLVRNKLPAILLGVGFLVFIFGLVLILRQSNPRLIQVQNNKDFHGRQAIWKASWQVIKNNWLFGVGFSGNTWNKYYNPEAEKFSAPLGFPPHNMFLTIWAKSGVISAGLLLLFLILKIYESGKRFFLSGEWYSLFLLGSTGWLFFQSQVENFPLMDLRIGAVFWILLALEGKQ